MSDARAEALGVLARREQRHAEARLPAAADMRIRRVMAERARRPQRTLHVLVLVTGVVLGGLTPWRSAQCQASRAVDEVGVIGGGSDLRARHETNRSRSGDWAECDRERARRKNRRNTLGISRILGRT